MAATNVSTMGTAIRTFWETNLIPKLKSKSLYEKFSSNTAVTKDNATGGIKINTIRRVAVPSSDLSESSTTGTPKAISSSAIIIEPTIFGDVFQFTDLMSRETFVKNSDFMDEIADQIVRTKEQRVAKAIMTRCMRHRVDNDGTYEVSGTVDSGTTTSFVDNALTQADNYWGTDTDNFGVAAFFAPEGACYDRAVRATDFTAASHTVTLETLQQAPDTSDKYHLTIPTDIAATDVMTVTAAIRVAAMHEALQTERFNGGMLMGFINSMQKADLYKDTAYLAAMTVYSKPEMIDKYRIIPLLDMNFIVHNTGTYREDVDGSTNLSDGICHVAPIFGKNAWRVTKWGDGADAYGVKISNFGGPNDPDTGNMWGLQKYTSWHGIAGIVTLRATSIIGLMTGATALPIDLIG